MPHPFPTALAANDVSRPVDALAIRVIRRSGSVSPFDASKITVAMTKAFLAVEGCQAAASTRVHDVVRNLYDGLTLAELAEAPVMAARTLIETEPNYAFASARLLLDKLRGEALSFLAGSPRTATQADMAPL